MGGSILLCDSFSYVQGYFVVTPCMLCAQFHLVGPVEVSDGANTRAFPAPTGTLSHNLIRKFDATQQ